MLPCTNVERGVVDSLGLRVLAPAAMNGKGHIGIRPSRLMVSREPAAGWRGKVVNVEDLGSSYLIHSLVAEKIRVISRMDSLADIPKVGEMVYLTAQNGCTIYFNEDGYNVNTSNGRKLQRTVTVENSTFQEASGLSFQHGLAV